MVEEFVFRLCFLVLYGVFGGVRVYYRSKNLGRKSEREVTQLSKSMIALSFAIVGYFIVIALWLLFPLLTGFFQLPIPLLIRWSGVGIAVVAIILLFWTHHTLGKQYSAKLEIQKEHKLIVEGPYKIVRHPMYIVFILFPVSLSIISANLLIIIFTILIALPFHWISQQEEKMLIEQFGDEYLEYQKTTGRFVPKFRRV